MDLPQDPNKWPDPEELHSTAFGSLFRNTNVEEKNRNDGLVSLIRSSLEWEYDGWTRATTAAAEATALQQQKKEADADKRKRRQGEVAAGGGSTAQRRKDGQAVREAYCNYVDDYGGGGGGGGGGPTSAPPSMVGSKSVGLPPTYGPFAHFATWMRRSAATIARPVGAWPADKARSSNQSMGQASLPSSMGVPPERMRASITCDTVVLTGIDAQMAYVTRAKAQTVFIASRWR
jgi:hypothetical protein